MKKLTLLLALVISLYSRSTYTAAPATAGNAAAADTPLWQYQQTLGTLQNGKTWKMYSVTDNRTGNFLQHIVGTTPSHPTMIETSMIRDRIDRPNISQRFNAYIGLNAVLLAHKDQALQVNIERLVATHPHLHHSLMPLLYGFIYSRHHKGYHFSQLTTTTTTAPTAHIKVYSIIDERTRSNVVQTYMYPPKTGAFPHIACAHVLRGENEAGNYAIYKKLHAELLRHTELALRHYIITMINQNTNLAPLLKLSDGFTASAHSPLTIRQCNISHERLGILSSTPAQESNAEVTSPQHKRLKPTNQQ